MNPESNENQYSWVNLNQDLNNENKITYYRDLEGGRRLVVTISDKQNDLVFDPDLDEDNEDQKKQSTISIGVYPVDKEGQTIHMPIHNPIFPQEDEYLEFVKAATAANHIEIGVNINQPIGFINEKIDDLLDVASKLTDANDSENKDFEAIIGERKEEINSIYSIFNNDSSGIVNPSETEIISEITVTAAQPGMLVRKKFAGGVFLISSDVWIEDSEGGRDITRNTSRFNNLGELIYYGDFNNEKLIASYHLMKGMDNKKDHLSIRLGENTNGVSQIVTITADHLPGINTFVNHQTDWRSGIEDYLKGSTNIINLGITNYIPYPTEEALQIRKRYMGIVSFSYHSNHSLEFNVSDYFSSETKEPITHTFTSSLKEVQEKPLFETLKPIITAMSVDETTESIWAQYNFPFADIKHTFESRLNPYPLSRYMLSLPKTNDYARSSISETYAYDYLGRRAVATRKRWHNKKVIGTMVSNRSVEFLDDNSNPVARILMLESHITGHSIKRYDPALLFTYNGAEYKVLIQDNPGQDDSYIIKKVNIGGNRANAEIVGVLAEDNGDNDENDDHQDSNSEFLESLPTDTIKFLAGIIPEMLYAFYISLERDAIHNENLPMDNTGVAPYMNESPAIDELVDMLVYIGFQREEIEKLISEWE